MSFFFLIISAHSHRVLPEKEIGDEDGGDDAGEVGNEAAGYGVAGVLDADRAMNCFSVAAVNLSH